MREIQPPYLLHNHCALRTACVRNAQWLKSSSNATLTVSNDQAQLRKCRHGHRAFLRPRAAMQFDAFDRVQGFGSQIAFAAVGATDERDVLNDEQAGAATIATRDPPAGFRLPQTEFATGHEVLVIPILM